LLTFPLLQNIQTSSVVHPTYYSVSTGWFFLGGKAARAWSSPLRLRMIAGRPPVSHISLWYAQGQHYMPSPVVGNENGIMATSQPVSIEAW